MTEVADSVAGATKPRLLFFYESSDGKARRVEGYLAQVLQRRRNHETFVIHRVDVEQRPELAERFNIEATPTFVVVQEKRIRGQLERPRNAVEIQHLLTPWLRR
jgi:thioredoxin-like negative regulator of GroEL